MQTDVLILGAGLAGLSLADQLQRVGIDYQLIEARGRVGGRILSRPCAGGALDLGPAWFWPGQSRLAAMARRFDLTVFEQYAIGDIMSEDSHGTVRRGMGFASMQDSYRLAGGLGELTSALGAVLHEDRLHLNTKARSLQQHNTYVKARADTPDGLLDIDARKVVLAIPPRIIASSVQFSPEIPTEAKRALSSIPTWMAGQAKIVAVYDRPYWREAGLSGDAMSQLGPMVEIHDASAVKGEPYALFGFVGIPADIRSAHKEQLTQLAREQLQRIFGDVLPEPQKIFLQDWAEEEFTATQDDRVANGTHPAYLYPKAFQNIWDGSLVLGSTEVAPHFGGYLEGALEAAENALKLLPIKPQL